MTDKEQERFMPREEAKMRKWMYREMSYEQMAVQSNRYINECTGRNEASIEKNIFYRHCYVYFKAAAEKAHNKKEKWHERLLEKQNNEVKNEN